MIVVLLRDLRWRLVLLVGVSLVMFALEPGFHQHEGFDPVAVALGPLGVSATLSYLAGISMMVLLAGLVSDDRRDGHTRLFFSHPTSPLAYYGLRWAMAYVIAVTGAALFLVVGQIVAWGALLGGWSGLVLPLLSALVYGGLLAFFSVLLPRGDAGVVFLLFLPTFFPQLLAVGLAGVSPTVRQLIMLVLPPQGALQQVWEGLLIGSFAWGAAAFAAAYGLLFLAAAAVGLELREWP
jgi:hypothetical protein